MIFRFFVPTCRTTGTATEAKKETVRKIEPSLFSFLFRVSSGTFRRFRPLPFQKHVPSSLRESEGDVEPKFSDVLSVPFVSAAERGLELDYRIRRVEKPVSAVSDRSSVRDPSLEELRKFLSEEVPNLRPVGEGECEPHLAGASVLAVDERLPRSVARLRRVQAELLAYGELPMT